MKRCVVCAERPRWGLEDMCQTCLDQFERVTYPDSPECDEPDVDRSMGRPPGPAVRAEASTVNYAVRVASLHAWATDCDGGFALTRREARLWSMRRAAEIASLGSYDDAEVVEVGDEERWRAEVDEW